jgi:hypothetical protein
MPYHPHALGYDAADVEEDLAGRLGIVRGQLVQELLAEHEQLGSVSAHGRGALAGLAEERDLAEEISLLEEGDALALALHLARPFQDHEHLALADPRAGDEIPGLHVQEVAGLREVEERARREGVHEGGDRLVAGQEPVLEGLPHLLRIELHRDLLAFEEVPIGLEVERGALARSKYFLTSGATIEPERFSARGRRAR